MYDHLLVPLGPELQSNTVALDEAAEFAEEVGSSISLVYVWPTEKDREMHKESSEENPEPIQHALEYLDDSFDVDHDTESGEIGDEIVEKGYKVNADAIVMGTNASTGMKRLVIGSITEEVIRKTELPVVAVNHHEK